MRKKRKSGIDAKLAEFSIENAKILSIRRHRYISQEYLLRFNGPARFNMLMT